MKFLKQIDLATASGTVLALAAISLGLRLEGINANDIGQITAALIVFGGTIGAVLISMPLKHLTLALKAAPGMLYSSGQSDAELIDVIVSYARSARMRGISSLEQEIESLEDRFLRKGMRLAVDFAGPDMVKTILDSDIAGSKAQAETVAVVYETAAGYAPTLGMAGAAVGLIQVLKHLDHVEQVGMGVASAFVATIYGLLLANLVLLPIATKIRARAESRIGACALIKDGIFLIASGANPSLIRMNLEALAQIDRDGEQTSKAEAFSAAVQ